MVLIYGPGCVSKRRALVSICDRHATDLLCANDWRLRFESATDMHRSARGVGEIARLHFLWLWIVAYFYALGLISPVGRMYAASDVGIIAIAITLLINGIPAAALLVPAYYGLALLAGHHGESMHPAGRNLIGVLVLMSGFALGAVIQLGWYWMFEKLHGAIFRVTSFATTRRNFEGYGLQPRGFLSVVTGRQLIRSHSGHSEVEKQRDCVAQ